MAKPFVKWVGGKTQLLDQLETLLPADFDEWKEVTYIEPFVGGGAMLFYMLQSHSNIKYAIINDINADLITCYQVVKEYPSILVHSLQQLQTEYYALQKEEFRKQFYIKPVDLMSLLENTHRPLFAIRQRFMQITNFYKKWRYSPVTISRRLIMPRGKPYSISIRLIDH